MSWLDDCYLDMYDPLFDDRYDDYRYEDGECCNYRRGESKYSICDDCGAWVHKNQEVCSCKVKNLFSDRNIKKLKERFNASKISN